jgi:hypothetical protein
VLAVAAIAGIAVVIAAWWTGPSLFGGADSSDEQVVQATVKVPVTCDGGGQETVQVTVDGAPRAAQMSACGHSEGEQVQVAVPTEPPPGQLQVRTAETVQGVSDLRRPVGLALVALSCAGGGVYAFLVSRGRRRDAATPAAAPPRQPRGA